MKRREFIRLGLSGFASLSLPGLLRLQAASGSPSSLEGRAVILVWLRGGASHLETYDPKPASGKEFCGPFGSIPTNVPGMRLGELLPLHARIADKFTLVRSMSHSGGGHPAGSLQMLSGDPDPQDKLKPVFPDWMSVANYLRKDASQALPNYVGVNAIINYDNFTIAGPGYLGPRYSPFLVTGDPSDPKFEVPNIGLRPEDEGRFRERLTLKQELDRLDRAVDGAGSMRALDQFEAQALHLLTSPVARRAFDLKEEDERTRARYGNNQWGQQLLMARRMVEAGVQVVTTTLDGSPCGRVQNWDDHAVNHHIFDAMQFRAPVFDQCVTALIEDVYARGLDKRVMVIVTGEFGRSPRISTAESSGGGVASAAAGITQPGRDHWPKAFSMLWAGGNIPTGGIIGATDKRGEEVKERQLGPGDFLATIYAFLGINAAEITIPDFAGRPIPIVREGQPIQELVKVG